MKIKGFIEVPVNTANGMSLMQININHIISVIRENDTQTKIAVIPHKYEDFNTVADKPYNEVLILMQDAIGRE